ncbi:MAG: ATP synthase F0 subunit B [Pelagibacterales bacterium]|nr:ATP synthase F0 subunit B [Pelagibacterales bacterium]
MFDEKFWLGIAFLIVAGSIVKWVFPIIARSLDNKSKSIAEEILTAKEMKEAAERLLASAEKYYNESLAQSQKLIKDAEIEAARFLSDAQKSVNDEVSKRTSVAYDRIKLEEEKAIRDVKKAIIAAAIHTVEIESSKGLSKKDNDQILSQATQNFSKIVH